MPVIINGSTGISGVDGTAASPAIEGSDTNTGIFFPAADTIAFAEGGVEAMRIDSSGNVGIGTTNPQATLHIDSTGAATSVRLYNNNVLYTNFFGNSSGTTLSSVAAIPLIFSTTNTERLRIDSGGNVLVTGSGGLGYGTGSGGTVTQATSKSTAVTLNKYTGRITMSNAALAAGANVTFTVNNSLVAVGDIVSITHSSGGTIGNYFARIYGVGSGSFVVNMINQSAGSLSDAVVLSFAVTRSSAS